MNHAEKQRKTSMGKARDLFRKIRGTLTLTPKPNPNPNYNPLTFVHAKIIKKRNGQTSEA